MDEARTCGRGLAEHGAVAARLAGLISALADNLEAHLPALDAADPRAKTERDAYQSLLGQHRRIADALCAVSREMADQRYLPPAPHDARAMADPRVLQAFESYVRVEQELAAWLASEGQREARRLAHLRAPPAPPTVVR
jgi:hypothetical protein